MLTLKTRFLSGIRWNAISTVVVALLELLRLYILIRLLSTEDFGLFAMATIILFYADALKDLGFSGAIIHKDLNTRADLSSIFWITCLSNVLLAIICYVLAPLISGFFNSPALIELIRMVSLILVIGGFGAVFQSLLIKEMAFGKLSIASIIAGIVYFSSSIFFAYSGYGVLSLVYGLICKVLCETIFYVAFGLSYFVPQLSFSGKNLKYYLHFGGYQLGERILNVIRKELDTLLIGKFLGAEILGIYAVMKNLIIRPYTLINPLVTNVSMSYMSKVKDNISELKKIYLKQLNALTSINAFIYLFLAFFSFEVVRWYYGEQWEPYHMIFTILAVAIFLMSIANPVGTLIISSGRADKGFYWNVAALFVYGIALYIGVQYDLFYLALSILLVQIILFIPNYVYLIKSLTGTKFREYLASISRPIVIMLSVGLLVYFGAQYIQGTILTLSIALMACGVLYLFFLNKYQQESFYQLQLLIGLKK